ncbi:MAG: hypothetical protein QGG54_20670, partial [Gammaproteobacteria bacterium]|nr:hypothetical protein [Gammaproteobacteria bacterium]
DPFVAAALPYTDTGTAIEGFMNDYGSVLVTPYGYSGPDVVYSYTASGDGDVTISCGADFDNALAVFTDCADPAGSQVGTGTDGNWSIPYTESVTVAMTSGVTYYIVNGAYNSTDIGGWTMDISGGAAPMADLEVTSMSFADGVGSAVVTNIGDAQAISNFGDGGTIYWYVNDVYAGYEYPAPYDAGASQTHMLDGLTYEALGAGDHELKIIANALDEYDESDYTNNADSITFTIESPPAVPQNLTATAGDALVDLAWDPAPDDDALRLLNAHLPERLALPSKKLVSTIPNYEVLLEKIAQNQQSNASRDRTTGDACADPFVAAALPYTDTGTAIEGFMNDYG